MLGFQESIAVIKAQRPPPMAASREVLASPCCLPPTACHSHIFFWAPILRPVCPRVLARRT